MKNFTYFFEGYAQNCPYYFHCQMASNVIHVQMLQPGTKWKMKKITLTLTITIFWSKHQSKIFNLVVYQHIELCSVWYGTSVPNGTPKIDIKPFEII